MDTTIRRPHLTPVPAAGIEELYRSHGAKMLRLARLLTGSADAAEEVVQDAFMNVQRRWDRATNPAAYLRTAVVNGSRSHHRRRYRERAHQLPAERTHIDPDTDGMWDALATLGTRQRTALVLRYYEDLSTEDIAAVLRCRPGTVKSLIHRGLAALKETLDDA